MTYLFLQSENPKEILDDNLYRKRYSKINLRKLVLILEKYSNDKITPAGQSTGSPEVDKIMASMIIVHKSDA